MDPGFFDLHIEAQYLRENIDLAQLFGWSGVSLVSVLDHGFPDFLKVVGALRDGCGLTVLAGAKVVTKDPASVQDKARKALLAGADIVLVEGGDEEVNRAASECWEVDVLCHPEKMQSKDLMDQKNSGIDHVTARFMAEKCIALEINLSELLDSYGMYRSQVMGRMRQNVMLAKKYGTPLIITTGAGDKYSLRSARDMLSVGLSLGMDEDLARKSLTDHPMRIVKKSRDRADPDKLLSGLEVTDWGSSARPARKKTSGWY
jgi:ribonuclease P/MRP protein subunit RPP1